MCSKVCIQHFTNFISVAILFPSDFISNIHPFLRVDLGVLGFWGFGVLGFFIFRALEAYLIVLRDSSRFESLGLAHAIIVVLLLPPRLS